MSPRAAWRLERLGYRAVYDYAAGKVDWLAAGLATVRADTGERRAVDAADRHPLTCSPDDLVHDLVAATPASSVVVVNERRIVLGRYRASETWTNRSTRVAGVMEAAPTTIRAHEPLLPLLERMTCGTWPRSSLPRRRASYLVSSAGRPMDP